MSSGGAGGVRVSIPNSARKTIQDIKEITVSHSDEEVYAMLRECSMDPNETVQRLLIEDTFHEVKRKRDRKKENVTNREPSEARWRPGMQGRGSRSGRSNYSSHYTAYESEVAKKIIMGKENNVNQGLGKGSAPLVAQDMENKPALPTSNSVFIVANGLARPTPEALPHGTLSEGPQVNGITVSEEPYYAESYKSEHAAVPNSTSKIVVATKLDGRDQETLDRERSNNGIDSGAVGDKSSPSSSVNASLDTDISPGRFELPDKSEGNELNFMSEPSTVISATSSTGSSGSRPPSNYNNRSQQLSGSKKVGQWKPKSVNPNHVQAAGVIGSDVTSVSAEVFTPSLTPVGTEISCDSTSQIHAKLEELQFSDEPQVIIPNHIKVQEAERTNLSFGSFHTTLGSFHTTFGSFHSSSALPSSIASAPVCEKEGIPSESSVGNEERVEAPSSSPQDESSATKEECSDDSQLPSQIQQNQSSGNAIISTSVPVSQKHDLSKSETDLSSQGPQYSVVQTAPVYSTFGMMPTMLGSQFTPFDSSESQSHDSSRLPGFVVQQAFDPSASYYTQFYRSNADGDGRSSPIFTSGFAPKYNGNGPVLSTMPSSQESASSAVQPTSGSAPVGQAANVMQSALSFAQHPIPVFRQPAGLHLSPYPPNYFPYNQYFPPFYFPSSNIQQYLGNAPFPQQHPPSIYPSPMAATSTPNKYPNSQYKPSNVSGITNQNGTTAGYGPFSSNSTAYSPTPSASNTNPTGSEDLIGSQYRENNGYIAGQLSEGSPVWIPPGREIPGLQASPFYSLAAQGQHLPGHGTFAGVYHPTQAVASPPVQTLLQQSQPVAGVVEMSAPPGGVYQQSQRATVNWANSY